MGVILGHSANPGETVQYAGLLVTINRTKLEHPKRKLAVRTLARTEDQNVERTVHGLEVVILTLSLQLPL